MSEFVEECLKRAPREGPNSTAIEGLSIYRRSATSEPVNAVYERSIFLVAQGRKQAIVGDDRFVYDPDSYLLTSAPLPVLSEILVASPERPLLALVLEFELDVVRQIMSGAGNLPVPTAVEPAQRGLTACSVTGPIRDVAGRLMCLLDEPDDVAFLAPLYRRELLYHVLKGPRGGFLRALARGHGQQCAITNVLSRIHANCTSAFTVAELASEAAMSESLFYEAFKAVTATTPLQYIKHLRLHEAHRQLTLGLNNVSGAAYGVGYNSLSQFSREFTRVFGTNPSALLPK